jgi:hypothetical protein
LDQKRDFVRRIAEKALTAVVQEAYVHGVSTRSVDDSPILHAAIVKVGNRWQKSESSFPYLPILT